MHIWKPLHAGTQSMFMQTLPVEVPVAPLAVDDALDVVPLDDVDPLAVAPPLPPPPPPLVVPELVPVPDVVGFVVPLVGVNAGGSRLASSHPGAPITAPIVAQPTSTPSAGRRREAVGFMQRIVPPRARRVQQTRLLRQAVLSPHGMRLTPLLVALAVSAGAVGPAVAAPVDAHAKIAKGKPKKPRKPPTKKHAQAPAPKPAEAAPIVRPLLSLAETARVTDRAEDGLAIVAAQRPDFSSVALVLRVPFGAGDDPVGQAGAALVTLRAVEQAVAGELHALRAAGGDASFELEADGSVVRVRAPAGSTDAALALFAACFTVEPTAEEVGAARASIVDAPSADRVLRLAYQGWFPYEHAPEGTAASRATLDAKGVGALHAARWIPERSTVAVAGPADTTAVIDAIKARFAGPPPTRSAVARRGGELQEQTNQRAEDVEIAGASASLRYAWALPRATDAELAALDVAARLLSSRGLVEEGVGKLSVSAIVRARVERRAGPSVFVVDVRLPDDAPMKKARHAVEDVFLALSTKAATAIELAHAKEAGFVDVAASLDDPLAYAAWLAASGPKFDDARATLDAVTAENVRAVAAKFLGPLTRCVIQVTDPKRAATQEKGT